MKTIYAENTHGIINRVQGSVYGYQGWPTVARDENGTLYAVISGFRLQHVCTFGKTVMHISKDNGKTWTPPIVINDTYMDDRDAGIVYLGNGKMVVSWFTHSAHFYKNYLYDWIVSDVAYASPAALNMVKGALEDYDALPDCDKVGGSYVRVSEDYGVTWSDIIRVPVSAPHGPTVRKDGTLIYLGNKMYQDGINPSGNETKDDHERNNVCSIYESKDGGYTWEETGNFAAPAWLGEKESLCEPHILELQNGRIYGVFRLEGGGAFSIATTYSDDGGKTWSDIIPTGVAGAPPHLLQHSSGALIMSFGRRSEPFGEFAWVSYDNGTTWEEEYAINTNTDNGDLGYPATVELDDGSLLTVYYQKVPGDMKPSFLCTRWNLKK